MPPREKVVVNETNRYLRIFPWALAPRRGWSWVSGPGGRPSVRRRWGANAASNAGARERCSKPLALASLEKTNVKPIEAYTWQGFVGQLGCFLNSALSMKDAHTNKGSCLNAGETMKGNTHNVLPYSQSKLGKKNPKPFNLFFPPSGKTSYKKMRQTIFR